MFRSLQKCKEPGQELPLGAIVKQHLGLPQLLSVHDEITMGQSE